MSNKNSNFLSSSSSSTSKSTQKVDEAITSAFHETAVVSAIGFSEIGRLLKTYPLSFATILFGIGTVCYFGAEDRWIAEIIGQPDSEIIHNFLAPVYAAPWEYHFVGWFLVILLPLCLALGINGQMRLSKCRKIFENIRLTNGRGEVPVVVSRNVMDKYREVLEFDSKGIGRSKFEEKTGDIEAAFGKSVESITNGDDPSRVRIVLTTHKLPDRVTYDQVAKEKALPDNSFYIGESIEGIQTQDISELPHLLIAGATGGGKSVFFKQALLGLLQSTKHVQMYCIDLKGGLEMADFAPAPNVKVVKDMSQAVALLTSVEKEMKARFKYLEEHGYRDIDTVRDKRDRIIVAVDESSVLFTALPKSSNDHQSSVEARRLLDSLSKLSRAAGINIILATQKLDKQVLPTQVSENISGRMAFKANSVPGSAQVIYTRDAADLPQIKGRGIWLFGSDKAVVQAPYISEDEIKSFVKSYKEEFSNGNRKLQTPMLAFDAQKIAEDQKSIVEEVL